MAIPEEENIYNFAEPVAKDPPPAGDGSPELGAESFVEGEDDSKRKPGVPRAHDLAKLVRILHSSGPSWRSRLYPQERQLYGRPAWQDGGKEEAQN